MKILHFSDIHCNDRDLEEIKKCCNKVLETTKEEKPDIIVNAGDSSDSNGIKLDSDSARFLLEFHSALAEIAPVAIVLGTPSHDGKAALALEYLTNGHHSVLVSSKPEQLFFSQGELYLPRDFPKNGHPVQAVISMLPTPTKQFFQTQAGIEQSDQEIGNALGAILAGFGVKAAEFNCPHVLVFHMQVGGAFVSETQQLVGRDIEVSKDQLQLAQADLYCGGHLHFPQEFMPSGYYSGSIYCKDFGENHKHGFYVHDIESEPHFIEVPTRKLVKIERDLRTEFSDFLVLATQSEREEARDAFVRIELKVWQNEAGMVDREELTRRFLSAGAKEVDIRLIRMPRENVRSKTILKLSTLREKIEEQARLKNEEVPESILTKADLLETSAGDQILEVVARG